MTRLAPLPAAASVVIVGGGVIGTSAAFHLAEAGVDVVLLEREQLGSGSTCRAAGGVRAQFSDALNIEIAQRSLRAFREFARRPGWEIDFKQVGYLFVLSRESDVAVFERNVELQNEYGVPSRILSPAQARELCPLLAGGRHPRRGVLARGRPPTPEAVVQGYALGARALGAHIRVGCEVLDISSSGGEITEVITTHGADPHRNVVVCAAGAWSRSCGEMVGVELPVTPLRRQVLFTEPISDLSPHLPMTIDFASSFYFHREGPGVLLGMSDPEREARLRHRDVGRLDPAADRDRVATRAADRRRGHSRRLGRSLRDDARPQRDHRRGRAASRAFYTRPASRATASCRVRRSARSCATWCCGARPPVDVGPLGVERFDAAALRPEYNVV